MKKFQINLWLPALLVVGLVSFLHSQNLSPVSYPAFPVSHAIPNGSITYIEGIEGAGGYVVYGNYTEMSGQPAQGLLYIDQDTVMVMDPNLAGTISAICYDGINEWFAFGSFSNNGGTNAARGVIGGTWNYFNIGDGAFIRDADNGTVTLNSAADRKVIVVGGEMQNGPGNYVVYKYLTDLDTAIQIGGTFNAPINTVVQNGPDHGYYVGGEFTISDNQSSSYMAVFYNNGPGAWEVGPSILDSTVFDITFVPNLEVIAAKKGGNGSVATHILLLSGTLGEYFLQDTSALGGIGIVGRGAVKRSYRRSYESIYFGDFTVYSDDGYGNGISLITNLNPPIQAPASTNGPVTGGGRWLCCQYYLIGGNFTEINGQNVPYLALVDPTLTNITGEVNRANRNSVYPNPSNGEIFIQINTVGRLENIQSQLIDPLGRMYQLASESLGSNRFKLDAERLSAGNYLLTIYAQGKVIETRQIQIR